MSDYEVIIIGGRCAGASLAIRLARQQIKTLVVDRSTFPSAPAVPSGPMIFDSAIRLLAELGLSEDEYALPGSQAQHFVVEFVDHFSAVMPCSLMELEHSYVCGLDRAHFDKALWQHMSSHTPYVTARSGFAVTDILKDGEGRVTGIVGKTPEGASEQFTADLVVGADGRFSFAARKFGAKMIEERNAYTTAVYMAQWENVPPYAEGLSSEVCNYNTGRNLQILMIPYAQGCYHVAAYMRSQDAQRGDQTAEDFYLTCLRRVPNAWKRFEQAHMLADTFEGIRPIENAYREPVGLGWALIGDAYHYKDPMDGQGVCDALIETKILAEAIGKWKSGQLTWEEAGTHYQEQAWVETYPIFLETIKRVQREVHAQVPSFIINTIVRWVATDPDFQALLLRSLARAIPPADVPAFPTPRMIARGVWRSIRSGS